ncbi:hypothetical protein LTR53_007492 [Teratosphaeriaceae sp. CCFEE 6253]|nr:hypothetical protein LTR53_007492 [Teratosphaeriaceae sp. CCFEE 6253]
MPPAVSGRRDAERQQQIAPRDTTDEGARPAPPIESRSIVQRSSRPADSSYGPVSRGVQPGYSPQNPYASPGPASSAPRTYAGPSTTPRLSAQPTSAARPVQTDNRAAAYVAGGRARPPTSASRNDDPESDGNESDDNEDNDNDNDSDESDRQADVTRRPPGAPSRQANPSSRPGTTSTQPYYYTRPGEPPLPQSTYASTLVQRPYDPRHANSAAVHSRDPAPGNPRNGQADDSQGFTAQGFTWKYIDIIIELGRAKITIRIWWPWYVKTDARLLAQGITATSMLTLQAGKTIDGFRPRDSDFYACGQVFAVPWSQETVPAMTDEIKSKMWVPETRRSPAGEVEECVFVVIADRDGSIFSALPIARQTDYAPRSRRAQDGAIIYATGEDRDILARKERAEATQMIRGQVPISYIYLRVKSDDESLVPGSWIDFNMLCSVSTDIPARRIGTIHPESLMEFRNRFLMSRRDGARTSEASRGPRDGPSSGANAVASARAAETTSPAYPSRVSVQAPSSSSAWADPTRTESAGRSAGGPSHTRNDSVLGTGAPTTAVASERLMFLTMCARAAQVTLPRLSEAQAKQLVESLEQRQRFFEALRAAQGRG